MRQILVAVDDSPSSERVSEFVNAFFGGLDVSVTAVNVGQQPIAWGPHSAPSGVLYPWPYAPAPAVGPTGTEVPAGAGVDETHEAGERTIATSGIHADDDVVEPGGDVAETLRRLASERDVDLLVVGSTHKGALERLLSPSVSTDLAKSAPTPVLIVH